MFYTIYKITNLINNKFYIGKHQTTNVDDGYMGSGKLIIAAIKKYGVSNFKKDILHIFDNEQEMNNAEKNLVILSEDSYNLCPGGHGGFGYINKNIDLQQRNRDINSRKNYNDPVLRQRLSEGIKRSLLFRKKPILSDEAKVRQIAPLSKGNTPEAIIKKKETWKKNNRGVGKNNSQFGSCWITNGTENKKIKKEELDFYIEKGYSKGRINLRVA